MGVLKPLQVLREPFGCSQHYVCLSGASGIGGTVEMLCETLKDVFVFYCLKAKVFYCLCLKHVIIVVISFCRYYFAFKCISN